MKFKKLVIAVVLLALVIAPALLMERPVAAQSDDTVVWAFVPSENSQKVLNSAEALAKLVSEKSGVKLKIVVATEFAGVIEAMCNGQAQIGALNTFAYILASSRKCADVGMVSVRNNSTSYRGQIITRADSGIKKLEDLKGKTFCRPDPLSTSGWIIPSIALKAAKIDPAKDLKQIADVGGHDGVVENVYNKNCDAGATFDDARTNLEKKYPDVRDKVVIIAYSAAIPNDTVSFAPKFDAKKREAIIKALTEISANKENVAMLTAVYNWTGLAEAKDAFFDDFRQQLDASGVKVQELMPTKAPTAAATAAGTAAATSAATTAPTAAATK